jgi:xylose isomerase
MEYFPDIEPIRYEGLDSDNHLAFRYYDENLVVADKTMKDHFRFAMAYWHSMYSRGPYRPIRWRMPKRGWMQPSNS